MTRDDYIQASTRTRVLEKRLLSRAQYDQLVEAKDMDEVFRLLSETVYGPYFSKADTPQSLDNAVDQALKDFYRDMRSMAPDKELVDIFLLKYRIHNHKVFMKELLLGEDQSDVYMDIDDGDFLERKETLMLMDEQLREREFPAYFAQALAAFDKTKDAQFIDIYADAAYFEKMLEYADELDVPMITEYVRDLIDFTNLKTLFRMRRQMRNATLVDDALIAGGNLAKNEISARFFDSVEDVVAQLKLKKVGSALQKGFEAYETNHKLASFEKYFENHSMDRLKDAKMINYGPEVLFAFMLAKETEIKNLRLILVSKLNNLPPEKIRERLRGTYV
ncbi:MAG TPA: V-type ATP synthase subunit C [Tissierellia bacterium]|nr:V-type ATP synthase subunit C [Tissierellia bacterium]